MHGAPIQKIKYTNAKPKNPLAGAINIAIEDAERYGTPLVIKGKDGKIREISPAQMRRLVSKKK
jgi:hypothetical protein